MDPIDRLAAYLAGELDADEHSALEGQLGRDPVLRAQLDAMRHADLLLRELRSPEPPAGFDERLRAKLDPVVTDVILETGGADGASAGQTLPDGATDELTVRRARRERRSWLPAVAGIAAAASVIVGGGIVLSSVGGADDEASVAMDAMDDAESMERGDEGATLESMPAAPDGPIIANLDRDLGEDEVDALLISPDLDRVVVRQLDEAAGAALAEDWRVALGSSRADGDIADAEEEREDAAVSGGSRTDRQVLGGELTGEDEAAIDRCLTDLLAEDGAVLPAYVELARFLGEPALVFGLVTVDPATGAYTRPEAWVLARADCQVLRFSQG